MRRAAGLLGFALVLAPMSTGAQQLSVPEQRIALTRANQSARAARLRAARLDRDAARARDDAVRARQQRAAVAARAEAAEADIAAARARIALVERALADQRRRLDQRRAPMIRLVAALQSMARRPASLALVQPGSARDAVHVRALLATIGPVVQARSAAVRHEIERTRRLRAGAQLAAASLRDSRTRLERERLRLVEMEAESRLRSRDLARGALVESDRAIALGEEARDIVDRIEQAGVADATRERLDALDAPLPRPGGGDDTPVAGPPPYRLPVKGAVVTGMGEVSDSGVRARGLTVAVDPGSTVAAPAAGEVVFARPFGVYGIVVILNHGDGWTTLLSGLSSAQVRRGERVGQGMPIGRAGSGREPRITVELRRQGVPFDLVTLLR